MRKQTGEPITAPDNPEEELARQQGSRNFARADPTGWAAAEELTHRLVPEVAGGGQATDTTDSCLALDQGTPDARQTAADLAAGLAAGPAEQGEQEGIEPMPRGAPEQVGVCPAEGGAARMVVPADQTLAPAADQRREGAAAAGPTPYSGFAGGMARGPDLVTRTPSVRLPPLSEIKRFNTTRLLPAKYSESVLTRIADSDEDLQLIFALESATNERLLAEQNLRLGISARELVFAVPHARIINAAFTHPHPQGGRFSMPYRGAWYAGLELQTAKAEVLFHRTLQFREINWQQPEELEYDQYLADFSGSFHDLRPQAVSHDHPGKDRLASDNPAEDDPGREKAGAEKRSSPLVEQAEGGTRRLSESRTRTGSDERTGAENEQKEQERMRPRRAHVANQASAHNSAQTVAELREFAACLDPRSYVASQQLALQLLEAGSLGILYPSTRRIGGHCIACFRPSLVSNVRKRDLFRLTWYPDRPATFLSHSRDEGGGPQAAQPVFSPPRAGPSREELRIDKGLARDRMQGG